MRELLVIGYEDAFKADEVLAELNRRGKEHLIDLGDAAVVIKDGDGKIKFKHFHELTSKSAKTNSWWGILLGFLFLNPGMGALISSSVGELSSSLLDFGMDEVFMEQLGDTLKPNRSALFILVRHANPNLVLEELQPFGGRVLRTSLSAKDEVKLRAALSQHA